MGIFWDPIFGWDWDRMRMVIGWTTFLFLFTGFVSATEGNSFFAPTLYLVSYIKSHEVVAIVFVLMLAMATYWWWRREAGW